MATWLTVLRNITGAILREPIKRKFESSFALILVGQRFGLEFLEDSFESVYSHAVVLIAAESRAEAWIEFLRDEKVVAIFRRSWTRGDREALEKNLRRIMTTRRVGEPLRLENLDPETEMAGFLEAFDRMTELTLDRNQCSACPGIRTRADSG